MLVEGLIPNGWLLALVAAVGLWEVAAPRHRLVARRSLRWPTGFTLAPLNGLLATLPLAPAALALALTERGGMLAMDVGVPQWLAIALAVPLLDFVVYVQHRLLHAVPILWSTHRVHHSDVDFDYTTAFRFHPLEALLTNATLLVTVAMFGVPAFAVLVHQALAGGMTILEHANARVPCALESRVGRIVVTPGMHRVHHSAAASSTDSNFGTIFSVWDRWLGTYRSPPTSDRDDLEIGLREFREPKYLTLPWTLAIPFLHTREADRHRSAPPPSKAQTV